MLKQRINSQRAEKKDDLLRSSLAVILCKTQKYSLLIVKTLRGPPSATLSCNIQAYSLGRHLGVG